MRVSPSGKASVRKTGAFFHPLRKPKQRALFPNGRVPKNCERPSTRLAFRADRRAIVPARAPKMPRHRKAKARRREPRSRPRSFRGIPSHLQTLNLILASLRAATRLFGDDACHSALAAPYVTPRYLSTIPRRKGKAMPACKVIESESAPFSLTGPMPPAGGLPRVLSRSRRGSSIPAPSTWPRRSIRPGGWL